MNGLLALEAYYDIQKALVTGKSQGKHKETANDIREDIKKYDEYLEKKVKKAKSRIKNTLS